MNTRTSAIAIPVLALLLGVYLTSGWQAAEAQELPPQPSPTIVMDDTMGMQGVPAPIPSVADEMLLSEGDFFSPAFSPDYGMSCWPAWYVRGEALLISNETYDRVSLTRDFELAPFAYESGMRITAGRRRDCSDGWEVSYMGGLDWISEAEVTGENLSGTRLVSANGQVDLSAFSQANYQYQRYKSSLFSIEAHQRYYDWDTMTCLLGIRYLDLSESYDFLSQRPINDGVETGLFQSRIQNRLIGPQAGVEMLHPVGATNILTVSGRLKGGIYANIVDGRTQVINADVVQFDNRVETFQIAGIFELGFNAHLQLTRRLSAHAGYELWYLPGVALAPAQNVSPMTLDTGNRIRTDREAWFHGLSLGGQYTW